MKMIKIDTVNDAKSIAVSLSNTSKMPCKSYSIPAEACMVGSKLRKVAGSTCSKCYACKGAYAWGNVQKALEKRLESLTHPLWAQAMAKMIGKAELFRWHDSGDLQGVWHLENIVKVCALTPNTMHWIPTREKGIVAQYLRENGSFPANLIVRISSAMIDGKAPTAEHTSTVHKDSAPVGHECPAYKQNGECGDCRACWNKSIANVSYPIH